MKGEKRLTAKLCIRTRGAPAKPIEKRRTKSRYKQDAPLTPAMELFIVRYVVRFNATKAYMDSHPNASYSTAMCEGSKLLADPRISKEIKHWISEAKKRLAHSANRVLDELSALAFSVLSDLYDSSGAIIVPNGMPRDIAAAVKKLKRNEILGPIDEETGRRTILGHTVEVELHDKVGPLKLLAKHLGLFTEAPRELKLGKDFSAILEAAGKRALDAARQRVVEDAAERGK